MNVTCMFRLSRRVSTSKKPIEVNHYRYDVSADENQPPRVPLVFNFSSIISKQKRTLATSALLIENAEAETRRVAKIANFIVGY